MPSKHPPRSGGRRATKCRECGALAADGAEISARDLCSDCSVTRVVDAADQIRAQSGPHFEEWRRGVIAHAQTLISH